MSRNEADSSLNLTVSSQGTVARDGQPPSANTGAQPKAGGNTQYFQMNDGHTSQNIGSSSSSNPISIGMKSHTLNLVTGASLGYGRRLRQQGGGELPDFAKEPHIAHPPG